MKKLLNLFAGITLVTAGACTVVACNDENKPNTPSDTSKVDAIINKIKKRSVVVDPGSDTNVNEPDTLKQIINALKDENNLSSIEAQAISFEDPPFLEAGKPETVETTIKVGDVSKVINIQILLAETLQEQIEAFREKINFDDPLKIQAAADDPTITDPTALENVQNHFQAIKNALFANYPTLTEDDFQRIISFQSLPLVLGQTVNVTAKVRFEDSLGRTQTEDFDLKVVRAETDLEKAQAIANKMVDRNLFVPNNTTTATAQARVKTALQNVPNNKTLNVDDLAKIMIEPPYTFVDDPGVAKQIKAIITVGRDKVTVPLTVTQHTTAYENAQNIKKRIPFTGTSQQSAINISADDLKDGAFIIGTNLKEYDASKPETGVQAAINRGLQTRSNNQITASDIQHITYTGTIAEKPDLTQGPPATTLTGTIHYPGEASQKAVTFQVNVYIAHNKFTKGDALRDKINVRNYDIGLVPDLEVSHEGTSSQLRNIVQKDNNLTAAEAKQIYFDPKTLQPGTDTAVSMNIANGRIIIPIQVKALQSAVQYVGTIQKLFSDQNPNLFGSNNFANKEASDPDVTAFIRTELLDIGFTDDMFDIITFSSVALPENATTQVTATIGNSAKTFQVVERAVFNVTLE